MENGNARPPESGIAVDTSGRNNLPNNASQRPRHARQPTIPQYHSRRKKQRRWPLVLRFVKGAIHSDIAVPVLLHTAWAALISYLEFCSAGDFALPSTIVPSLSIVVGLMLVFRNSTSYDRFWQGNQHLTTISTCIRNLTRSFLTCSFATNAPPPSEAERADTERSVRVLLALIYAAKNHLRAEWSGASVKPEYSDLLSPGTRAFEEEGLGLALQLSVQVEAYIRRAFDRGWVHAPQASQLSVQLNTLVGAYGSMETIHLTPLPVAYLIHLKQVMGLFGAMLPFGIVASMRWWTIPMVGVVMFTLYGIEAIGAQLEDPFGYDRNDIKIDAVAEDLRVEVGVLLDEWRRGSNIFPQNKLV